MSTSTKTTQEKPKSHISKSSTKANAKLSKKTNSPMNDILNLHQTMGNQAVQQLFKSGVIQGNFAHTVKSTIQKKANKTGLPNNLKDSIESLSGYSMNDVKVHYNSPKPAQLNAHAYAKGSNIHLASGAEKHLPHEAWHVVQQKQGRVQPTKQLKEKVNINDDEGLEREADVMGERALQMKQVDKKQLSQFLLPSLKMTQKSLFIQLSPKKNINEVTLGDNNSNNQMATSLGLIIERATNNAQDYVKSINDATKAFKVYADEKFEKEESNTTINFAIAMLNQAYATISSSFIGTFTTPLGRALASLICSEVQNHFNKIKGGITSKDSLKIQVNYTIDETNNMASKVHAQVKTHFKSEVTKIITKLRSTKFQNLTIEEQGLIATFHRNEATWDKNLYKYYSVPNPKMLKTTVLFYRSLIQVFEDQYIMNIEALEHGFYDRMKMRIWRGIIASSRAQTAAIKLYNKMKITRTPIK